MWHAQEPPDRADATTRISGKGCATISSACPRAWGGVRAVWPPFFAWEAAAALPAPVCGVSTLPRRPRVRTRRERKKVCEEGRQRERAREREGEREPRARERERDPVSDESNCPSPAAGAARVAKAARASRREHGPGRPRAMRHARMTSQRTRQAKERTLAVKYRAAARASQCASGLDT